MTETFIEQCRREWRHMGVAEDVAGEMANELRADLDQAARDGRGLSDVLGVDALEPTRFAAAWASERGFKQPSRPPWLRWRLVAVAAVAVTVAVVAAVLVTGGSHGPASSAPLVHIPDVRGMSGTAAKTALVAAGLRPTVTLKVDAKASPGQVIDQHPGPGMEEATSSSVVLVLAKKP